MRDRIDYEWAIRTFTIDGDITNNEFSESLGWFWDDELRNAITEADDTRLELVMYIGNEAEGCKEIDYAEIFDGELQDTFQGGHRVPKRYHEQLARLCRRLGIQGGLSQSSPSILRSVAGRVSHS